MAPHVTDPFGYFLNAYIHKIIFTFTEYFTAHILPFISVMRLYLCP